MCIRDRLDKSIKDTLGLDDGKILRHGLSSGGDYNLLFTLSSEHEEAFFNELNADAELKGFLVSVIGKIEAKDTVLNSSDTNTPSAQNLLSTDSSLIRLIDDDGNDFSIDLAASSYNHFTS